MAAFDHEGVSGYQCRFISEVSDDQLCKVCRLVARKSHITNCCGGLFCKICITQVLEANKPCSSCGEANFAIFPDVRTQKKILALQVYCTMKDCGCEWVGKLEDLRLHLLVDGNDCQFVDIECPDKCGESVPRNKLPSHLADSCLNRDYFCKYCNFSGTYHVVRYEHWPECPHYPVQCPNACSVGSVERGDLEDHIKVCLLQEVSCDFSHAGCKEVFLRENLERHMEENTQKHLLLMSAMNQRMCREFEQKLQQQREEKEREMKQIQQVLEGYKGQVTQIREEFEQKLQQQREEKKRETEQLQQTLEGKIAQVRKELKQKLQEKDDQIRALGEKRGQEIAALREEKDKQFKQMLQRMKSVVANIKANLPNGSTARLWVEY